MASLGSDEAMTPSLAEKSCKDVQLIIELNTTHLERLRRTASEERTSGEILGLNKLLETQKLDEF